MSAGGGTVQIDQDHQNDSTERVLKGPIGTRNRGAEIDHQNDSTERVLKALPVIRFSASARGPSKRLDRASTESTPYPTDDAVKTMTIKTTRQSEY